MTTRISNGEVIELQSQITDVQAQTIFDEKSEANAAPTEEDPYYILQYVTEDGKKLNFRSLKNFSPKVRTFATVESLAMDLRYKDFFNSSAFFIASCLYASQVTDTTEEYRNRGPIYNDVDILAIMDLPASEFENFMTAVSKIPAVIAILDATQKVTDKEPGKK